MTQKIKDLKGPILIIGASGFVGSNILRKVLAEREDVFGTSFSGSGWRLDDIPTSSIIHTNILFEDSIQDTLKKVCPKTIFDCSSFGAYSFESDFRLIHMTNYTSLINMLEIISTLDIHSYIHAGTSSEYGQGSPAVACQKRRIHVRTIKKTGINLPTSHIFQLSYKNPQFKK